MGNIIHLRKLRPVKINPSLRLKKVENVDVKLMLDKKGWFVKQRQSSEHQIWSRITPFQWLTQISGWLFVIKALITIFLIDEHSEWNHYLGDYSPAFSKSIILIILFN